MKYRYLLILLLVPFLTGCNVDVNLEITTSGVDEKILFVNYIDENNTEENIVKSFRQFEPNNAADMDKITNEDERVSGVSYYDREQEVFNTFIKNTYSTSHSLKSFNKSRILSAFKSAQFIDGVEYYEISTDKSGIML